MITDVRCLQCGKKMNMSDVIGGKKPFTKTMWFCKDSSIEITLVKDEDIGTTKYRRT